MSLRQDPSGRLSPQNDRLRIYVSGFGIRLDRVFNMRLMELSS